MTERQKYRAAFSGRPYLLEVTELLHLEVEIKSEEPGMGFWEHFHYKDGDCLCDETGDLISERFDMEVVA